MSFKSVYLAGPISFLSYEESTAWRRDARVRLLSLGISSLDPLRGKTFLAHKEAGEIEKAAALTGLTPNQIVTRDMNDIRKCNLVLANLSDVRKNGTVMMGTPMEIFFASHDLGKPVIAVANDYTGPWLERFCIRIVPTLEQAYTIIQQYFTE
jgi:nucleoside 2-deoxyribosyltransferase